MENELSGCPLLDYHADFTLLNNAGYTAVEEAGCNGGLAPTQIENVVAAFETHPWTSNEIRTLQHDGRLPTRREKFSFETLKYGSRTEYLRPVAEILGTAPPPTQEALFENISREFARNLQWEIDGQTHNSGDCWSSSLEKLPELREAALRRGFELSDAQLLGLRLYTTAAYSPLNRYLRAAGRQAFGDDLCSEDRAALISPWPSFVWAVLQGFHKIAPRERIPGGALPDRCPTLYRGVTRALQAEFFVPDDRGMVAAVDYAFASTSLDPGIAENFRGDAEEHCAVFIIKTSVPDAAGFHNGVDLRWCSAFEEEEVLFPPFTLFRVLRAKRAAATPSLIELEVSPTWSMDFSA